MSFHRSTTPAPTLSPAEQKALLKKTGELLGAEREHMLYSLALGTALREHELVALNVADVVHAGKIRSKIHLTIFKGSRIVRKTKAAAPPRRPPRQVVYVPKSARRKLVYYLKWKKARSESLRPDAPLFAVSKDSARAELGGRLSTRTLRHHFRRWQIKCGFEELHGFHVLRHTSLSNAYRRTKDLGLVQRQARHASVDTTEIYTHMTEDEIAMAVEDLPC